MKICNLGHARSRTTFLIRTLANYYSLKDLGETYGSRKKQGQSSDTYKSKIKSFTNLLFTNDNFIIKVWPRYFCSAPLVDSFENLILELDFYFKFSQYDKIIITERDPVESLCSLRIGEKFNYNYYTEDQVTHYRNVRYENKENNIIDVNNKYNKDFLMEIFLMPHIANYLTEKQIPFERLSFDEIPNYCNNYIDSKNLFSIKKPVPLDSGTDYKLCINNYDEVVDFVHKYKLEVEDQLSQIRFI